MHINNHSLFIKCLSILKCYTGWHSPISSYIYNNAEIYILGLDKEMADKRKLQGEIERCLKKVQEGVDVFEDLWQKVHNATNYNIKEKHEADLKKEIKKLQRLRDAIKTWLQSTDIKDKKNLIDTKKLIETQMERFKVVERETKTKAYSKEGLGSATKVDPKEKEKEDITNWLSNSIGTLKLQVDQYESEIESIAGRKKKLDKEKQDQVDAMRVSLERHRHHIGRLETIMRLVDNDALAFDMINKVRDDVEYYISSSRDADYEENLEMYDDLHLEEVLAALGSKLAALLVDDDHSLNLSDSSEPSSNCPSPTLSSVSQSKDLNNEDENHLRRKSHSEDTPTQSLRLSNNLKLQHSSTSTRSNPHIPSRQSSVPTVLLEHYNTCQNAAAINVQNYAQAAGSNNIVISSSIQKSYTPSRGLNPLMGKEAGDAGLDLRPDPTPLLLGNKLPTSSLLNFSINCTTHSETTGPRIPSLSQMAAATPLLSLQLPSKLVPLDLMSTGVLAKEASSASVSTNLAAIINSVAASSADAVAEVSASSSVSPAGLMAGALSQSRLDSLTSQVLSSLSTPYFNLASSSQSTTNQPPSTIKLEPILGVTPLGRLPLNKQHGVQMAMLAAAADHMPMTIDSQHLRPNVPLTPCLMPSYYQQLPPALTDSVEHFMRLQPETLFFLFYYMEGSKAQYMAAKALKQLSWRFHTKHLMWFQRYDEPKVMTEEYEQGTYVYFDYEKWTQRTQESFFFEYKYLEDRDLS